MQAASHYERASDLVGLYEELAERVGQPVDHAEFVAPLGLPEQEAIEAVLWSNMIEDWAVSAPYPCKGPREFAMADDIEKRLREVTAEAVADPALGWTRIDAKTTLGFVNVDRVLGLKGDERRGKAAYFVTYLTSPDDREVEFSLGSDDWVEVWVNGEEVHRHTVGRTAAPDQDRFKAKMRAGQNGVLVKIGNQREEWRFYLAPISGEEGLTVAAPQPWHPSSVEAMNREYKPERVMQARP